jgi:hypothetical protein
MPSARPRAAGPSGRDEVGVRGWMGWMRGRNGVMR